MREGFEDSASSPAKVQPRQEGTLAPPPLLLQAPEALQQVLPATPPAVAKWAAKWRTRPRYLSIKIGGELLARRTLPPIQGAASPEEGTPRRPPPATAAPLALPPPCGGDSWDASQPQVSICTVCSLTETKLHDLHADVQCLMPVAHVAHSLSELLSAMLAVLVHLRHAAVLQEWPLTCVGHACVLLHSDVNLESGPLLCSWTWRQGHAM